MQAGEQVNLLGNNVTIPKYMSTDDSLDSHNKLTMENIRHLMIDLVGKDPEKVQSMSGYYFSHYNGLYNANPEIQSLPLEESLKAFAEIIRLLDES